MQSSRARRRNDPGQYDELVDAWWDPKGPFAMLQWIARARAGLIPPASAPGAVIVDIGCGGGLLAPHASEKGYAHIGVDLTLSALVRAQSHGMIAVRGDALRLPLRDECAEVVSAGEILEHVDDTQAALAEACRVLKPGGLLVVDTLADTAIARLLSVTIAERIPGGAPVGIHDPALFVDRDELIRECAANGVKVEMRGLRPSLRGWMAWGTGNPAAGRMVSTRSTAVLFQAWGRKETK